MYQSAFRMREEQPTEESLEKKLGSTYPLWQEIEKHLIQAFGEIIKEWKYYGAKSGWLLKMLKKKRNLFFLIPMEGLFVISFVFGDKAVAKIMEADLPDQIKTKLQEARKYAEGRGLPIEVRSEQEVEQIKILLEMKINN